MTKNIGHLKKLKSELASPINYYFRVNEQQILLNTSLGKHITLTHTGNIACIQCGRKTNKSFQQGYCFPCLRRLQECHLCVIHPERCLVEMGKCPENDWAHAQCNQPHIVYLANASGLKVGITRDTQVPTRWIDQGAIQALPIFKVSNRYQAGVMEVALKQFVADRTNWRVMLKNQMVPLDLIVERDKLLHQAEKEILTVMNQFKADDIVRMNTAEVTVLSYPVLTYPQQVNALSLEQTTEISGELLGIKGQYLILSDGVLNLRKFAGYEIEFHLG
jgi:hypothetical protein